MEQELLDREVLCILDMRGLQKFIFHSNTMADTVGASGLIKHLLMDAFLYAVSHLDPPLRPDEYCLPLENPNDPCPYFTDRGLKICVLTFASGFMILLFRKGSLCSETVRKISRFFILHAYSEHIAAAWVEKTENIQSDIKRLYERLDQVKEDFTASQPMEALPIVRVEKNTGEPVAKIDPKTGEGISRLSEIRQTASSGGNNKVDQVDVSPYIDVNGDAYYAVAHMDGNNMRASIANVLRQARDYPEYIRFMRRINIAIDNGIQDSVQGALNELKTEMGLRDEDLDREIRIVHIGGDDLNIIANPKVIFRFTTLYIRRLKKLVLLETDDFRFGLSACTGIAFVPVGTPFVYAFSVAEKICSDAKNTGKLPGNLINGQCGSWVDFQFLHPDMPEDSPSAIKRSNTTRDGVHLMLRPYCFDSDFDGTPRSFESFNQRAAAFAALNLPQNWLSQIMLASSLGRKEIAAVVKDLSLSGIPVAEKCGKPVVRWKGDLYAPWCDALECRELFSVRDGLTKEDKR